MYPAITYVIERRDTPQGQWRTWPHAQPFASRVEALEEAARLAAQLPYPVRRWQVQPEFRAREVRLGCPRCFEGVEGALCEWHEAKLALAEARGEALRDAPRALPAPKPVRPSPRVRRSARSGYGPEAVAALRQHHAGGAE